MKAISYGAALAIAVVWLLVMSEAQAKQVEHDLTIEFQQGAADQIRKWEAEIRAKRDGQTRRLIIEWSNADRETKGARMITKLHTLEADEGTRGDVRVRARNEKGVSDWTERATFIHGIRPPMVTPGRPELRPDILPEPPPWMLPDPLPMVLSTTVCYTYPAGMYGADKVDAGDQGAADALEDLPAPTEVEAARAAADEPAALVIDCSVEECAALE